MKGRTIAILSVVLGIGGLAAGLFFHIKREWKYLENYCYKLKYITLKTVTKSIVTMDVTMLVRNMSDLNLILTEYYFKIYFNNIYVCDASYNQPIDLPENSISKFTITISFDPSKVFNVDSLLTLGESFILNSKSSIILMDGWFSLKHSFIKLNKLPLQTSSSVGDLTAPPTTDLPVSDSELPECTI